MPEVILVTGGARSGKSRFALRRALTYKERIFLATAEPLDDEMRRRIEHHRKEREGLFSTVEEPRNLSRAIKNVPSDTEVILIDCLTVWLGNLMHHYGSEADHFPEIASFLETLKKPPCDIIAVTNEVGLGIVPGDPLSRAYRDHAGNLNQAVAALAQEAYLLVSGMPLTLKGK